MADDLPPHDPAPDAARPLAGIGWMLLTGLFFVAFTATVKTLGDALPAAQSAFLRFAFGLAVLLPAIPALRSVDWRPLGGLFVLRGVLHTVAVVLWFYAMARLPIAEVTALNYLSPVFVILGAGLLLNERLSAARLGAVAVAFLGALLVLRPGFRDLTPAHLAMIGTGLSLGGSYLVAKRLSGAAPASVVVGAMSVVVTVLLAPVALAVWVPPTPAQLALLALVAALATAGHWTMTRAFAAAPVSVTQPVTFLQLVWASVLGAALFGEPLDPFVAAGGAVIVAAVTFAAWRDGRAGQGSRDGRAGKGSRDGRAGKGSRDGRPGKGSRDGRA